jgi:hypothetical protein
MSNPKHVHHYPTLTDMWHGEVERQLFAKKKELDFIASIDTIRYDCLLSCDSMEYDFDSGRDLWLMKPRFTILQRDYLDLYNLEAFLKRCKEIGLGEAKRGVVTQLFAKQHAMREKKYRWGNCMLGWDFRGGDRYGSPTLTMHSRVSYIAYIGGLDLALCYVLAREIGERIGLAPEDFSFRWNLTSSQFHGFKSLPLLYSLNYEDLLLHEGEYPSAKYPTLKLVRKWHSGVVGDHEAGVPLTEQKYGPLRRIRRRYEEFKSGKRYSTPLDSLTLNPLRERG